MGKKTKKSMAKEIALAAGVTAEMVGPTLKLKGPKGEFTRELDNPRIIVTVENNKVKLDSKKITKREKKLIGSYSAHIKNANRGVSEGHTYKLKICSGHFPMTVSVSGKEIQIKNFLGEKIPRKMTFNDNVQVKIEGTEVIIESTDKEAAGNTASKLEKLTRRKGFDPRIFQDGLYITHKDQKEIK